MPRSLGPPRAKLYAEARGRYRVRVIIDGAAKSRTFASHKAATDFLRTIESELPVATRERPLEALIAAYCADKVRRGTCKPQTSAEQLERLRNFLRSDLQSDISAITRSRAAQIYQAATQQLDARRGTQRQAATHRHYLALAKGFFAWAEKQGLVRENPWRDVQPIGRVRSGKNQLSIDEAERFIATALRLHEEHADGLALAALVALMMGFRASELLSRTVRDLDGNGAYLRVGEGKTKNARRMLRVPAVLRPRLASLAQDKPRDALLFGQDRQGKPLRRQLLNSAVHRVCRMAGVPLVCPHSLRGLWATISVETGALPDAVAAALGHGSFAITAKHYAQPEALHSAQTSRLEETFGLDLRTLVSRLSADELLSLLPQSTLVEIIAKLGPAHAAPVPALPATARLKKIAR